MIDDIVQTLEMLEKKEKMLLRNIATEIEKVWDFTRTKRIREVIRVVVTCQSK